MGFVTAYDEIVVQTYTNIYLDVTLKAISLTS